uniref:Sushi domain-containing protein n=1 Tax=Kryptolebias marmoratus TaxID=37003 RepID=A0A3Q3BHK7_KRYMA
CQMDPVRLSVWVLMICLNRITRESGNENCLCSKIPQRPFTKRPEETCIGTASRFRYVCNDTFVRQAGTSNLIKCLKGSKWSNNLNLICIRKRFETKTELFGHSDGSNAVPAVKHGGGSIMLCYWCTTQTG